MKMGGGLQARSRSLSRGVPIHGAASLHVVLDLAPSSAPPLVCGCFHRGAAEVDFLVASAMLSRLSFRIRRFLAPQTELLAIDPE